jgi:hypothetical protein
MAHGKIWTAYPESHTVTAHTPDSSRVYAENDVLPGFAVRAGELFA